MPPISNQTRSAEDKYEPKKSNDKIITVLARSLDMIYLPIILSTFPYGFESISEESASDDVEPISVDLFNRTNSLETDEIGTNGNLKRFYISTDQELDNVHLPS
ncbi:9485_t:CDS:2 [Entrophospora sp. SA101]|nr:9485_t:CDS:2 [Entrophospora sp. SA101]